MVQQAYEYVSSSSKHIFRAKHHKHIEKNGWRLEKSEVAMGTDFFLAVGVLPFKLLAC